MIMAHEFFKEKIRVGIDKTQQDAILGKVTWAVAWKFNFAGMANMGGHIGMLRSVRKWVDREAISPRENFECKAKHATSLWLLNYHLWLYVNLFGIYLHF